MEKAEIREKVSEGQVHASAILEMVGKPKEHIEKTLNDYVEKIGENENYHLISKNIEEAKETDDGMFSIFADIEFLAKTIEHVTWFCFDFMPSSVEIISPESIRHNSHEFTNFLNDLQARLHHIDMTVKTVNARNQKLNANTENLLKNSVKLAIDSGKKTLADISKSLGVAEENMAKILNGMVGDEVLDLDDDGNYSFVNK